MIRRPARLSLLVLAALALLSWGAFSLARPRVEATVRQRIHRGAAGAGFSATLGATTLRPWLALDLHDLVLENARGVRIRSRVQSGFGRRFPGSGSRDVLRASRTSVCSSSSRRVFASTSSPRPG